MTHGLSLQDSAEQYALLSIPDDQLDEAQKKEKKRQRLLKAGAEARERKRLEKEAKAAQEAELKREERERFARDPVAFLADLRQRKQEVIERRAKRLREKAELSNRRSAASKRRMRVLADMGTGTMEGSTFGADDADWDVYRRVSKKGGSGATDSESEEESSAIRQLSELLREYDPESEEHTRETVGSAAEHHQIYCSVQRIRQPEILFQPSMIGIDQTGIAETLRVVLSRLDPVVQSRVAQNVLVTGGPSRLPQMRDRLELELTKMRPWKSPSRVVASVDGSWDAWRGARLFAASQQQQQLLEFSVDRQTYEECGGAYLKQHRFSNAMLTPSPPP